MNTPKISPPLPRARIEFPQGTLAERIALAEQRLVARDQGLSAPCTGGAATRAKSHRAAPHGAPGGIHAGCAGPRVGRLAAAAAQVGYGRARHPAGGDACSPIGFTLWRGSLGTRRSPALAARARGLERACGARDGVDSRRIGPAFGRVAVQETYARAPVIPALRVSAPDCVSLAPLLPGSLLASGSVPPIQDRSSGHVEAPPAGMVLPCRNRFESSSPLRPALMQSRRVAAP